MRGVLLDGFVCGTWRKERTRGKATLVIEPFRDALVEEGERLVRFTREGAGVFEVRFAEP